MTLGENYKQKREEGLRQALGTLAFTVSDRSQRGHQGDGPERDKTNQKTGVTEARRGHCDFTHRRA